MVFRDAHLSPLQKERVHYQPKVPKILKNPLQISIEALEGKETLDSEIASFFPHSLNLKTLRFIEGGNHFYTPKRVGVVFSGGPAPGGHNVIVGLFDAIKKLHKDSILYGFLGGPIGIVTNDYKELKADDLFCYRNQGGFDLIGSGRDKIESEEHLKSALDNVNNLQLDGLLIIGGDDSNTNAAILAEYFKKNGCKTAVVGIPKTIDGDLKNKHIETSFGFDTACKVYSEIIGNIQKDALSSKKYTHFIRLMGRSASHITLECALQVQPNMALISEEVAHKKMTLKEIVLDIADLIQERAEVQKNYAVILIPEGLIEFIPEIKGLIKELSALLAINEGVEKLSEDAYASYQMLPKGIQEQLLKERDPHGNLQVSFIETEKLLSMLVEEELEKRKKEGSFKGKFSSQTHFLGYEGRCAMPSNFDADYCYALGIGAALLIFNNHSGTMCVLQNLKEASEKWRVIAIPLIYHLAMEERKGKRKPVIKKALVDLQGELFKSFLRERDAWRVLDAYLSPGPIQFYGREELKEAKTRTLTAIALQA